MMKSSPQLKQVWMSFKVKTEMVKQITNLVTVTCSLFLFCPVASATVSLPKLVSNGMVLQRKTKVNVWGWASPSEKVTIRFHEKTYHATTGQDKNGR